MKTLSIALAFLFITPPLFAQRPRMGGGMGGMGGGMFGMHGDRGPGFDKSGPDNIHRAMWLQHQWNATFEMPAIGFVIGERIQSRKDLGRMLAA